MCMRGPMNFFIDELLVNLLLDLGEDFDNHKVKRIINPLLV